AWPRSDVPVGGGIAGAPKRQDEARIAAPGHPTRTASGFPRRAAAGFVSRLARTGDGVEPPTLLACLGVVGGKKPADAVLATGRSYDHHVFDDKWRNGQ